MPRRISSFITSCFILSSLLHVAVLGWGQKPGKGQNHRQPEATSELIGSFQALDNGLTSWKIEGVLSDSVTCFFHWDFRPALELESAGIGEALARVIAEQLQQDTVGSHATWQWSITSQSAWMQCAQADLEACSRSFIGALIAPNIEQLWPVVRERWLQDWDIEVTAPASAQARVTRLNLFTPQHPYGELSQIKSIERIAWEDIRDFHLTYWRPNNAGMVWAGHSGRDDALMPETWSKALMTWENRAVEAATIVIPGRPNRVECAIIDRQDALARLSLAHIVRIKPDHSDVLALNMLETWLQQRAAATVALQADPIMGTFIANWVGPLDEVQSAITGLQSLMEQATTTPLEEPQMKDLRTQTRDRLLSALQSPESMGPVWFRCNVWQLGNGHNVGGLLDSLLMPISGRDIQRVAINYLRPHHLHLIAQGPRTQLESELSAWGNSETFLLFDSSGVRLSNYGAAEEGLTATDVFNQYYEARGGRGDLESLKSVRQTGTMAAGGQMVMELEEIDVFGLGHRTAIGLDGQTMMEYRVRPGEGVSFQMGQRRTMPLEEIQRYEPRLSSTPYLHLEALHLTAQLAGSMNIEGKPMHVVELHKAGTLLQTLFFDASTHLLMRITEERMGPTGPVMLTTAISGYKSFGDFLFPTEIARLSNNQKMIITIEDVMLNPRVDKSIFTWE